MGEPTLRSGLLTRRALLRTGAVGVAAVVVGGAVVAVRDSRLRSLPGGGLHVLSQAELATLTAIADRVAPGSSDAPSASTVQVAERADALLAVTDAETQQGIKIALTVFESGLIGLVFGERVTPFTRLSGAAQDAALAAWRDSSVAFRRTVHYSLVSLCAALYCGDRSAWPVSGYSGPPSPKALRTGFSMSLVDLHALRVGRAPGSTPDLPSPAPGASVDAGTAIDGDAGRAVATPDVEAR